MNQNAMRLPGGGGVVTNFAESRMRDNPKNSVENRQENVHTNFGRRDKKPKRDKSLGQAKLAGWELSRYLGCHSQPTGLAGRKFD